MKTKKLYIDKIHCTSCESIIETKLENFPGIEVAIVSRKDDSVTIQYKNNLDIAKINKLFAENNYRFSEKKWSSQINENKSTGLVISILIATIIIMLFFALEKSGLSGISQVNENSSLLTFFIFGLIASISSCAALIGGIVLSLSKKWDENYSSEKTFSKRIKPQLMFNLGRLISYALLGGLLGFMGSKLGFSPIFSSALILAVSAIMILLGLQMLEIRWFQKIRIALPKFITQKISTTSHDLGHKAPFLIGALTFFLPCGFTITAQGFALLSGSFVLGSMIMLMFALGTMPVLLGIGLASVKFISTHKTSLLFSKTAGLIIIFFALFNVNAQLSVLGFSNAGDLLSNPSANSSTSSKSSSPQKSVQSKVDNLPPLVDGKQIVKIAATSSAYSPSYIQVRQNIPVELQIEDRGTSGCTNAVISKSLFEGQIELTPGKISTKEFLPDKIGKFKFSCWMGMVSGTIEVI